MRIKTQYNMIAIAASVCGIMLGMGMNVRPATADDFGWSYNLGGTSSYDGTASGVGSYYSVSGSVGQYGVVYSQGHGWADFTDSNTMTCDVLSLANSYLAATYPLNATGAASAYAWLSMGPGAQWKDYTTGQNAGSPTAGVSFHYNIIWSGVAMAAASYNMVNGVWQSNQGTASAAAGLQWTNTGNLIPYGTSDGIFNATSDQSLSALSPDIQTFGGGIYPMFNYPTDPYMNWNQTVLRGRGGFAIIQNGTPVYESHDDGATGSYDETLVFSASYVAANNVNGSVSVSPTQFSLGLSSSANSHDGSSAIGDMFAILRCTAP